MHLECKRCVELFDVSDVMSLTRYTLDYNNTERSGNYTVNMTVFAGKTKTNTEEFFVNYGYAEVMLEEMPQLVENGTTTTQWYTIIAVGGDLANVTSGISINDTSVLNITAAENTTKNISYLACGNSTALVWDIEGNSIGAVELNITTNTTNNIAGKSNEIEVAAQSDTEAPNVTAERYTILGAGLTPDAAENVTHTIIPR